MRIFEALHRFAETDEGNIKKLQGQSGELRLRVGDYRVRFTEEPGGTLRIQSPLASHAKEFTLFSSSSDIR